MKQQDTKQTVLVVDFGSQVTQLIARRVREHGVHSEVVPFDKSEAALLALKPRALILSGGPSSTYAEKAPRAPDALFKSGLPILGICYGNQTMVTQLGGMVEGGHAAEFGRAELTITDDCALFDGFWRKGDVDPVWMSHGDKITRIPEGFRAVATSPNSPYSVIADDVRKFYGVLFHPEVVHTPRGSALLGNFVRKIAGIPGTWTMEQFRSAEIARIRSKVGKSKIICGLWGIS
jgi:GMP synthase (glutamine-hydrolysing)